MLGDTNLFDVWNQADISEGGTYQPPDYQNPTEVFFPSSGGTNHDSNGEFWNAISTAVRGATSILGTRYAVPQLNPGQLVQTSPGGTTLYQGGANNIYPNLPSLGTGLSGGILPLLLIGGGALFLFSRSGKG
jgi:hypothetical protein